MGQLAGDALGSLVEFMTPQEIARRYPEGVRDLADGGVWNTIAGQPTDDSEMALALARSLVEFGRYDSAAVKAAYVAWLDSRPFDCGATVAAGLRGRPNPESQANGALMRVSPLGVFGASRSSEEVAAWARKDAALTHPHPVCQQANALFAMAIAHAIRTGCDGLTLYGRVVEWAESHATDQTLMTVIRAAADRPPESFTRQQGWVLIAFQNTLFHLQHAAGPEDAMIATVSQGGDADTNGAICGALLGAVHGLDAIPTRWTDAILVCRPEAGQVGVNRPRPRVYWPTDALELAEGLLTVRP